MYYCILDYDQTDQEHKYNSHQADREGQTFCSTFQLHRHLK